MSHARASWPNAPPDAVLFSHGMVACGTGPPHTARASVAKFSANDELRASLDDAGFRPVDERDLALSRALNSGYLLRLRVEPKLTGLDPRLGGQLGLLPPFPSSVAAAPGVKDQVWMQRWLRSVRRGQPPEAEASREELEVLSGGRVAVFVRGYGVEGLRSRMVLPKLNYLLE